MKSRAKKVQKSWWSCIEYTEDELDIAASALADNIKNCSCYMCGNPRKHFNEETLQEKRANLEEEYPSW